MLLDIATTAIGWLLFFIYRKSFIEPQRFGYSIPVEFDKNFLLGIALVPLFFVALFALAGSYNDVYRKSRIKELFQVINATVFGVLLLFFVILLDDAVPDYKAYYKTIITLFFLLFIPVATGRMMLTGATIRSIRNRKIGFNTLIIGDQEKALSLFRELENEKRSQGYFIRGYLSINPNQQKMHGQLPHLGAWQQVLKVIEDKHIEEALIAIETSEHHVLTEIIDLLDDSGVRIKIMPDMYDIVSGSVKMTHIFGAPLIEVSTEIMPYWQQVAKRGMDVFVSLLFLLLWSPIFILIAIAIRLNSEGPILFRQERIGWHGKPFYILKFRTMRKDAEKAGPQLSATNDERRTQVGIFLRKYRLDELPQFWNVLIGEMSLVGVRPERQFFIQQIVQKAPHYRHLLKVKPGITSWGQVKFGYAENVDQMVERMKYDLLYIENMSLLVDLRILWYTFLTILRGKGK